MRIIVIITFCLIWNQNIGLAFTVENALFLAKAHSLQRNIFESRISEANNMKKKAQSSYFPSLSSDNILSPKRSYATLNLTQRIYDGGLTSSQSDFAQALKLSAEANFKITSQNLQKSAIESFFDILILKEQFEFNENNQKTYQRLVTLLKKASKMGILGNESFELLIQQESIANLATMSLKSAIDMSLHQFKHLIGRPDLSVTISEFEAPIFVLSTPLIAPRELSSKILKNSAYHDEFAAKKTMAQAKYDSENAIDKPKLSAFADYGYKSETADDLLFKEEASREERFGIRVNVPLFSGLSSFHRRSEYLETARQIDLEKETFNLEINNLASQKLAELDFLRFKYRQLKELAIGSETLLSKTTDFLLKGLTSPEKWTAAMTNHIKIQNDRIQTMFAFMKVTHTLNLICECSVFRR